MHQTLTDSIYLYQSVQMMHPKWRQFRGRSFTGFIEKQFKLWKQLRLDRFYRDSKVTSYSACYLTNGDYIKYLLEKL